MKQKIIHQIFLKVSDKSMSDFGYDKNSEIWREWCKKNGYKYMLHNSASLNKIMTTKDKQMRNKVKTDRRHPFINLDWGKYLVVNHYGGCYVDLDVIPTDKSLSYLQRPPPILSSWRDKTGKPVCNTQLIIFDKGTLRELLDFAYEEYDKKNLKGFQKQQTAFYFQVAGPKMMCKWAEENGIGYQKDFHKFFIDKETRAWMKK